MNTSGKSAPVLVKCLLRVLCGGIDFIIVLIPIQFVMMGIFGVSQGQAELLFKFLFAVYGVLFLEYCKGQTPGKIFGKLRVADMDGGKCSLMYLGLRELSKSLYLIPVIGWILCAVSIGMLFFGSGRMLHDYVARTRVVFAWQQAAAEGEVSGYE